MLAIKFDLIGLIGNIISFDNDHKGYKDVDC